MPNGEGSSQGAWVNRHIVVAAILAAFVMGLAASGCRGQEDAHSSPELRHAEAELHAQALAGTEFYTLAGKVEQAISEYEKIKGRWPVSYDEVLEAGLLREPVSYVADDGTGHPVKKRFEFGPSAVVLEFAQTTETEAKYRISIHGQSDELVVRSR